MASITQHPIIPVVAIATISFQVPTRSDSPIGENGGRKCRSGDVAASPEATRTNGAGATARVPLDQVGAHA